MGDDIVLEAIGKGNIKATMQMGGKLTHTTITQVLHVPKMKNSLISVSKLISEGFKMEFDNDGLGQQCSRSCYDRSMKGQEREGA
jgi:hypothetical protein